MSAFSYIFAIISLMQICSCSRGSANGHFENGSMRENSYRTEEVILQDSLAKVILNVPLELDTFYTRYLMSDVNCHHSIQYNFSDSDFPIYRGGGGGFLMEVLPDTGYEMTISHVYGVGSDCKLSYIETFDQEFLFEVAQSTERYRSNDGKKPFTWISKEVKNINERPFIVLAYQSEWPPRSKNQKYPSITLSGMTLSDSMYINFNYVCNTNDCESFVPRMMNSLESVKLVKLKK